MELVVTSKTGTGMFGLRPVAGVPALRHNFKTTFNPQKKHHHAITQKPKIGNCPHLSKTADEYRWKKLFTIKIVNSWERGAPAPHIVQFSFDITSVAQSFIPDKCFSLSAVAQAARRKLQRQRRFQLARRRTTRR